MRRIQLLVPIILTVAALGEAGHSPSIIVGPNILVSRDVDRPHVETTIAVSPTQPANLLACSIVITDTRENTTTKAYQSVDGGYTWRDYSFIDPYEQGGGDPQVAFGAHGTRYFLTIANRTPENEGGVLFYRSEDGRTWSSALSLGHGDHEQVVVDTTGGRFHGRLYVGMLTTSKSTGSRHDQIHILHSDDDGRSFAASAVAADDPPHGLNVLNMFVLSNGDLIVPLIKYELEEEKRRAAKTSPIDFTISTDGGVMFSKPRPAGEIVLRDYEQSRDPARKRSLASGTWPQFAVDRSNHFRDRIYAVWSDYRGGESRLLFTLSGDRGNTWSPAKFLSPDVPTSSSQYQGIVAVNEDGVVGIEWFDTRHSKAGDSFDVYFTASEDGGATFAQPVKVSSASSYPLRAGNMRPLMLTDMGKNPVLRKSYEIKDPNAVEFRPASERWLDGGDYIGLVADSGGNFHLLWPDSRSGTYQLLTSIVRVGPPAKSIVETATAIRGDDLSNRIELVFDPIQIDDRTSEAVIPVRLRNSSSEPIGGPLLVEITSLMPPNSATKYQAGPNIPEFLNSNNGQKNIGAVFDYSTALGSDSVLPPGGLTEALPWRIHYKNQAVRTFWFQYAVKR